ncbi:MAG: hypothetical protein AAFY41_16770, partial [Bacteroidota bacterium]
INELYLGNEGFVWVGTRDGLNRFDGYNFLQFGQGPFSETGLSLGDIRRIGRDLENKFAIFYNDFYGYFDLFDPENFSTEVVKLAPSAGVLGIPRTLTIDEEIGRIFAVTIGKNEGTVLYEYAVEEGEKVFKEINRLDDKWTEISTPVELLPLRNGQFLLFDTKYGLRHLNANGQFLRQVNLRSLNAKPISGSGNYERLAFIAEGPRNQVYFSFANHTGIYRWNIGDGISPKPVKGLPAKWIYPKLFKDQRGQMLLMVREKMGPVEQPDHFYLIDTLENIRPFDHLLRAGNRIYAAASEDFSEKIFLGMHNGLGVVSKQPNRLTTFLANDQELASFQHLVRGITEDKEGNIYFLEQSGQLYQLNRQSGVVDTVRLHIPAKN